MNATPRTMRTLARLSANASILGSFASLGAGAALATGHPVTLTPCLIACACSAALAIIAPAFAARAQ